MGSVVYQGPDKVILSNFKVILFCHPGGARNYLQSGYFLIYIQIGTFDYTHLGFQFSDFQLKSFVDPKPVEL